MEVEAAKVGLFARPSANCGLEKVKSARQGVKIGRRFLATTRELENHKLDVLGENSALRNF